MGSDLARKETLAPGTTWRSGAVDFEVVGAGANPDRAGLERLHAAFRRAELFHESLPAQIQDAISR